MKCKAFILTCVAATAACAEESDHNPLVVLVDGDRFVAIGEIDGTTLNTFEGMVDDNPNIRTLVLKHVGGSVDDDANVEFSRVIRDMGFTTIVPSDGLVASGGTDLFLAGKNRIIEFGACVGVHSWASEDYTATDIPRNSKEHDRYLDYYDDIEINTNFYWFTIQAAPSNGMHWMTPAEIDRFGISTTPAKVLSTDATCENR